MVERIGKQFRVRRPSGQPALSEDERVEVWKEVLLQTGDAMNDIWPEKQPLPRADVTQGQAAIDEFMRFQKHS